MEPELHFVYVIEDTAKYPFFLNRIQIFSRTTNNIVVVHKNSSFAGYIKSEDKRMSVIETNDDTLCSELLSKSRLVMVLSAGADSIPLSLPTTVKRLNYT